MCIDAKNNKKDAAPVIEIQERKIEVPYKSFLEYLNSYIGLDDDVKKFLLSEADPSSYYVS